MRATDFLIAAATTTSSIVGLIDMCQAVGRMKNREYKKAVSNFTAGAKRLIICTLAVIGAVYLGISATELYQKSNHRPPLSDLSGLPNASYGRVVKFCASLTKTRKVDEQGLAHFIDRPNFNCLEKVYGLPEDVFQLIGSSDIPKTLGTTVGQYCDDTLPTSSNTPEQCIQDLFTKNMNVLRNLLV